MTLRDRILSLSDDGRAQVLDSLGLEPKADPMTMILPALGIFSAGLAVGAMLGLFLAPKSGDALRSDIRSRARELRERAPEVIQRNSKVDAEASVEKSG